MTREATSDEARDIRRAAKAGTARAIEDEDIGMADDIRQLIEDD